MLNRIQKFAGSRRVLIAAATVLLLGVAILFIEGCVKLPLNYLPGSVNKISGNVLVSGFKYIPAATGKVKPFQITNTALRNLRFNKDISIFFRDAVSLELLSAGVKIDSKTMVLSGEIEDFLIDDSSFKVDLTLKVHYFVKNVSTGEIVYTSTKNTMRTASKLADLNSVLNEIIKLNIEELLKDKAFIKAIN